MSEKIYDVPADWVKRAYIDDAKYREMYKRSVQDPEGFWGEHGKRIDWFKPYTKVKDNSWDSHHVSIKWFEDGETNVAYNCVDRHLPKRANQTAIIWEGDNPSESRNITYAELSEEVNRFANVLHWHGVKKGDRVTIYLPMIPEAAFSSASSSPARASERSIRSCSAASPPTPSPAASMTHSPRSSSPPTRACVAAARCRSKPMSTRR